MFNSYLINAYPDLRNAIQKRQIEIVTIPYEIWMDAGDQIFDDYFSLYFPPGFIERDKERARRVIREIYDIVHSPVIRHNPEAIHCYVMYQMIDGWFDCRYDDEFTEPSDLLPDDVKKFLARSDLEDGDPEDEDDLSEADQIKRWFTDKYFCMDDFELVYDGDYMDATFAEDIAEMFLQWGHVPDVLGVDIRELVELLPNDQYYRVVEILRQDEIEANHYVETIWPNMEGFFNVLRHSGTEVSSQEGAMYILWIFKDWVENNGGWKDIQDADSKLREGVIRRMIHLGAKTYLKNENLDMTREGNLGVGQEDFKICRGNDKTIIEVKLTNNPNCRHGFEKQLPRYAEAEHTKNMIYCLIDLGDPRVVEEISGLQGENKPKLVIIDATPKKSASLL